ncbi:MAG: DUF4272 domain-containing protein, partial [Janthinobacterium lividum]
AESHAQAGLDDMPAKPAANAVPGHSPNVHPTSDNPDVAPAVQEPRVEKAPDPSVLPHVSAPVLPEEDAWPDAPPEVSAPPVVPVVEDVSSASPDLVVITLEDDRLNQASGPEIELEVDPDPSRLELAVLEEPQTAPVLLSTQQRRQLRSEQIIYATLRMTPNPAIAPVPDDDAINIRVPGQIAMRARCLLSVIAWASGFRLEQEARGGGVPQELIEETLGEGMQRRLTRMEQLFLETDPPGTRERHAVAWRIEALAVLLRVIGVMPRLPSPAEEVNPETVFNLAFEALIRRNEKPGLALGESGLLDLLDLYRRLHGLVQEKGQIGIQTDVLRERRHALEWLITEADSKSLAWDEVDLVIPMRPGA